MHPGLFRQFRARLFYLGGGFIFCAAMLMIPFLFFAPPSDRTHGFLLVIGNLIVGSVMHLIGRWLRSRGDG